MRRLLPALAIGVCAACLWLILTQPATAADRAVVPAPATAQFFDARAAQQWEASLEPSAARRMVRLAARRFEADPELPLPAPGGVFYLTLNGSMDAATETALEACGARALGFIGPNTWIVRLGNFVQRASLHTRLMGNPRVAGTSLRRSADGMSRGLWNLLNDGPFVGANVRVMFWRDATAILADHAISEARAEDLLVSRGPDGLPRMQSSYIELRVDDTGAKALADNPAVAFVELALPRRSLNQASVAIAKANQVINAPYSLDGTGQVVAIWDGSGAFNHSDYGGRVTIVSPFQVGGNGDHATHVIGTILGSGAGNAGAKGFAPAATGFSYNFFGDIPAERRLRRHNSLHVVDNHSYGTSAGPGAGPYGGYDLYASLMDFDNRDMLMVMCKGAGNDGTFGSNTVFDDSCIKNGFTVGSVNDDGIVISNFSSRGPADDGRLVPQIAANGETLFSTLPGNLYGLGTGTSMSTPSTSGAIALLSQLWKREHNNMELAPDVARAVLFQTAVDRGLAGPDYQFGFGVVDVKAAADLILADKASGARHIVRGCVEQGGTVSYDLNVSPSTPLLKMTLTWLDEAGMPGAGVALVNDLDLQLVDPSGTVHFPYSGLTGNGNQTTAFTQTTPNRRDNAEQAVITSPLAGHWFIRVKAFNLASAQRPQGFVLASNLPMTHNHAFYEDAANPPNNGTPVAIPDNLIDGLSRTFNVSQTDLVTHVRLYVTIQHAVRGQLQIKLRHPDSTEIVIEQNDSFTSDSNRMGIFALYPDTRASFQPMTSLIGKPANGPWTVTISDLTNGTTGHLLYLALELEFNSSPLTGLPPIAHAGADQQVFEGDPVTLNASGSSDPESMALTFTWTQISGLPIVALNNANTATPSFTAPQVPADRTFVFRVTVTDPSFLSDSATVSILVRDIASTNLPPVANAGPDQQVPLGALVQLNGSGSSDPEGNTLTYHWLQLSGGAAVSLSDQSAVQPTFVAPSTPAVLTFQLIVDDNNGGSATDLVSITVGTITPFQPKTSSGGGGGGACTLTSSTSVLLPAGLLFLALAAIFLRRRKLQNIDITT